VLARHLHLRDEFAGGAQGVHHVQYLAALPQASVARMKRSAIRDNGAATSRIPLRPSTSLRTGSMRATFETPFFRHKKPRRPEPSGFL
jgi:hypothetical protein